MISHPKNANIAYYLKYRPQSLGDLVGQDIVKKNLSAAFQQDRLSHAYLFVGPRGTGKTSTARILAKMVNCSAKQNVPCNECDTCISITDGSNLDLIEIDAASNRGIEDIRALRDKIKLSPTSLKKKVYIIDEVHMLTQEAFNALLKTLEEPPAHALFILATTDVAKVPQTIISRVQRLDFKLATMEQLLETLRKIAKEEKVDIDEDALKLLVKKSDGSFRDGVKLLDQISSLGGKITSQILEKFLKASNFEKLFQLVEDLSQKDTTKALTLVVKEIEDGVDIKDFMLALMGIYRNIVFIKNNLRDLVLENYSEEEIMGLIKISKTFTAQDLVRNLDSLQKALEQMRITSIPSLPLELAVVEICGEHQKIQIDQSISVSEETNKKLEVRNEKMDKEAGSRYQESQDISPQSPTSHITPPVSDSDSSDILKLKEKWTFVLETIRPFNFSLEALLRSVNITHCTDTTLIMEVPYSFHQRILESPKNREILESILSEILGRQIKISVSLGARPQRIEDLANIEVAQDDEIIRAAAEIFNSDTVN